MIGSIVNYLRTAVPPTCSKRRKSDLITYPLRQYLHTITCYIPSTCYLLRTAVAPTCNM